MSSKDATVTLIDGMKFAGTAGSGYSLTMDSAGEVGGANGGFSPMELMLVGLGGCTGMDVITILRKKRQSVTGLEIKIHGERSEQHPKVYTDITVEYVVRGRDIDPKAVEDAIRLSQEKYCSVSAMLGKSAQLRHSYRIQPESEPIASA